jgi:hypothetical protein
MVSALDISSKMRACKYAAHRSGMSFVGFPAFYRSELWFNSYFLFQAADTALCDDATFGF